MARRELKKPRIIPEKVVCFEVTNVCFPLPQTNVTNRHATSSPDLPPINPDSGTLVLKGAKNKMCRRLNLMGNQMVEGLWHRHVTI